MNKLRTTIFSLFFLGCCTVSTFAQNTQPSAELWSAIDVLVKKDIIMYQTDVKQYRLNEPMTRGEAAKMLWGFYNVFNREPISAYNCRGNVFADVGGAQPFCAYIESLVDNHIISTASAQYRPNQRMTRAEMITFLFRVVGFKSIEKNPGVIDVSPKTCGEHAGYIYNAMSLNLIQKKAVFRPNDAATRGEFMLLLFRILNGDAR